jgi:hypothetical protein
MTSYSQIIHFIALEPTIKKILGIKISIFLYLSRHEASPAKV